MSLKAKIEAIIYAAEEPITVEQISSLVKDLVLAEQAQALAVSQQPEQSSDYVQPEAAASEPAPEAAVPDAESSEATPEAPAAEGEAVAEVPAEASAAVEATDDTTPKKKAKKEISEDAKIRQYVRGIIEQLIADYDASDRGMEIRAIAGGYRMTTRPEHHDVVR